MKETESGFTLIGLMVLAIILAIGTIPFMLRTSCGCGGPAGNEASAFASLRTLSTVSEQYLNRFDTYPVTTPLATLEATGYVDSNLGGGSKSGYDFVFVGTATAWSCTAAPTTPGSTGKRYFFVDESGVIRWDGAAAATVASPAID
ncbi:MAG: pili assembly chaperone [Bacillota bacterium]|nr:MAG: pili assembly chaperone [Bacillota bacterium]